MAFATFATLIRRTAIRLPLALDQASRARYIPHAIRERRFATMSLSADSKCVGCEGIGETMSAAELEMQLPIIPDWKLNDDQTELLLHFRVRNFATALEYLNKVGAIAEAEGHHPDIAIKSYNHVHISLSTHSLGGITSNDIIMAAKIDTIPVEKRPLKKKKTEAASA